jgi:hypothetical protein
VDRRTRKGGCAAGGAGGLEEDATPSAGEGMEPEEAPDALASAEVGDTPGGQEGPGAEEAPGAGEVLLVDEAPAAEEALGWTKRRGGRGAGGGRGGG